MPTIEILLLRHAEKPDGFPGCPGLTANGEDDPYALTVRGWQRAGGLAALLGSSELLSTPLPTPDRIFASAFRPGGGHSRRPEQTVQPLADRLGHAVNLDWALHQEEALGAALAVGTGNALVCWQHQGLAALARAIAAPQRLSELPADWEWPEDRYDILWSVRRNGLGQAWHLTQYCLGLLAGDSNRPFDLSGTV